MSLEKIHSPRDLKSVPIKELPGIARQIRKKIIEVTSETGGHIAPSLGATDVIVALHYVLNAPRDKILWDVGHQAYAHKILTGRLKQFDTLRQLGGISGFPNKDESFYDIFTVGHSSTSISQALGLATARDLKGEKYNVVAFVGDAALAGGMAFEALNHAGHMKRNILIILNDNELSISKSVGALSSYLSRIMINPLYNKIRKDLQKVVKRVPFFGFKAFRAARKLEEGVKNLLVPGMLFEELGIRYFGPIDGHNIKLMISAFRNVLKLDGPKIIHVITKKGKGYEFAEKEPSGFHGTASFNINTGELKSIEAQTKKDDAYSDIFGRKLTELAEKNREIIAVTAAMPEGTGLLQFSKKFPERFFDVGIAEQHAVTFSAGLAKAGLRPVVAIYSTFLQRAYDQIIHDVCLQNLPVIFAIDRAGITGEDGPTHHGTFDISYLRHIPNMTVLAPRDGMELEKMLEFALEVKGPLAIRYPKGSSESHLPASTFHKIEMGKSEMLREGKDVAIIAIGSMVSNAIKIADLLSRENIESYVINARFIKPLDGEMLENITAKTKNMVIIEENIEAGGFGSAVLEFIEKENIKGVKVKRIAIPDEFIEHGKREELLKKYHFTADEIAETIKGEFFGK